MTDTVRESFEEIIEEFDTAMLITRSASGELHGRPMHIAGHTEAAQLTFATSIKSGKIDEIDEDHRAAVTMQGSNRYVSLAGSVKISNDGARIESVWSPGMKLWFPDGPEDPTLRLIDFIPVSGAYWDISGGESFEFLIEAGKALINDRKIDSDKAGDHKVARF